jgi:type I restriction enzyme, R subunit
LAEGLFIDRMDQNEEMFNRFMSDHTFQRMVEETLRNQVYERIRSEQQGPGDQAPCRQMAWNVSGFPLI